MLAEDVKEQDDDYLHPIKVRGNTGYIMMTYTVEHTHPGQCGFMAIIAPSSDSIESCLHSVARPFWEDETMYLICECIQQLMRQNIQKTFDNHCVTSQQIVGIDHCLQIRYECLKNQPIVFVFRIRNLHIRLEVKELT